MVFVPGEGFRAAHGLASPANVVVTREGRTLIASCVSDRDETTLRFTVSGLDPALIPESAQWQRAEGRATARVDHDRELAPHPRWTTGGMLRRQADGTVILDWTLKLERLARDVRSVELQVTGVGGDWTVAIPVAPTEESGVPARRVDAVDVHHGISVAAQLVARSADVTAIELLATAVPPPDPSERPKRLIRGLVSAMGTRLCDGMLSLRDDTGREHFERRPLRAGFGGRELRDVAVFPALPSDVRAGVLELQWIAVAEVSDESVTLPVPGVADITLGGCAAHVIVSRTTRPERPLPTQPDGPPAAVCDGPQVRVEVTPLDREAERQLILAEGIRIVGASDQGMTISHGIGQRSHLEIPDPDGTAREVALRGPLVRVAGPWRLEIPLA